MLKREQTRIRVALDLLRGSLPELRREIGPKHCLPLDYIEGAARHLEVLLGVREDR